MRQNSSSSQQGDNTEESHQQGVDEGSEFLQQQADMGRKLSEKDKRLMLERLKVLYG